MQTFSSSRRMLEGPTSADMSMAWVRVSWRSASTGCSRSFMGPVACLLFGCTVFLPKPITNPDGCQVQHDDDEHEEQRGGIDQRPRRFDVGALEAHVVDVEAEVHELALEVQERERAVQRQRRGE